jgi:hypothetical protein
MKANAETSEAKVAEVLRGEVNPASACSTDFDHWKAIIVLKARRYLSSNLSRNSQGFTPHLNMTIAFSFSDGGVYRDIGAGAGGRHARSSRWTRSTHSCGQCDATNTKPFPTGDNISDLFARVAVRIERKVVERFWPHLSSDRADFLMLAIRVVTKWITHDFVCFDIPQVHDLIGTWLSPPRCSP